MSNVDPFEAPERPAEAAPDMPGEGVFVVDLDGFEGPLDLLLALARQQKVDLRSLSILALAEQYLAYIREARRLRMEVAADYLVMAAWLAYLKSRLLLPEPQPDNEPSAADLAERLQSQLERLAAIRRASGQLMARPRLGLEVFGRGAAEAVPTVVRVAWQCSLYELLRGYAVQLDRGNVTQLKIRPPEARTVEEAIRRLEAVLGRLPDWATLETFLPDDLRDGFDARSAMAATLVATLELVRAGRLQVRQAQPFGPIMIKGVRQE